MTKNEKVLRILMQRANQYINISELRRLSLVREVPSVVYELKKKGLNIESYKLDREFWRHDFFYMLVIPKKMTLLQRIINFFK